MTAHPHIKMRIRRRRVPLLLLLLPTLAAAAPSDAPKGKVGSVQQLAGDPAVAAPVILPDAPAAVSSSKPDVGTKDAPVDGLDGKPKLGPFVDTSSRSKQPQNVEDITVTKKKPPKAPVEKPYDAAGATPEEREQHKLLMEAQESVMDDPNREAPKIGTTGTEGGVSEKDRLRKEQETSKQGPADVKRPETPKEAPALPENEETKAMLKKEQEKIAKANKEEEQKKGAVGLEVNSQSVIARLHSLNYDLRNRKIYLTSHSTSPIPYQRAPRRTTKQAHLHRLLQYHSPHRT